MVGEPGLARFAEAMARPKIELAHLALLIGECEQPGVDVTGYRRQLDEIAVVARQAVDHRRQPPLQRALAVCDVLFTQMQFRGNVEYYDDPRNSFLGQVIDRRLGIPVTLSVLFLEVARRVGVLAQGVTFPGHFLVRVADDDRWRFLDPFHAGRLLETEDLRALLRRFAGPTATLEPALLSAATNEQIVARILTNLRGIYGRLGDLPRMMMVMERMAILDPHNRALLRALDEVRREVTTLN
jgi:regulator of sirC expression with transglutaminase-like and TPR domain